MDPLKFHPSSTPGSSWKTSGKHLEHTWNPHGSTQIPPKFHPGSSWKTPGIHMSPPKFHPGSTLDQLQCFPGMYLEKAWTTWIPPGIQQHTHTICGIYLNSMELPQNMWNQCGFHVERCRAAHHTILQVWPYI